MDRKSANDGESEATEKVRANHQLLAKASSRQIHRFYGAMVRKKLPSEGYAQFQADQIVRAQALGARGLKVLKTLGLYLREQVTSGPRARLMTPLRSDVGSGRRSSHAGRHSSLIGAFFLPTDRCERYEG